MAIATGWLLRAFMKSDSDVGNVLKEFGGVLVSAFTSWINRCYKGIKFDLRFRSQPHSPTHNNNTLNKFINSIFILLLPPLQPKFP